MAFKLRVTAVCDICKGKEVHISLTKDDLDSCQNPEYKSFPTSVIQVLRPHSWLAKDGAWGGEKMVICKECRAITNV